MLYLKLIAAADNVVFATHIMSKQMWPETTKYNPGKLGQLGRIISLINFSFPPPLEFQAYSPITLDSHWGKIKIKKILDIISGKSLYFTGGNAICCLANTIKSTYCLPKLFDQNLTLTALKDYIWAVDEFGNILTLDQYLSPSLVTRSLGLGGIPEKKMRFLSYSFTYWRTHGAYMLPLNNAAKHHSVNVFFHYNEHAYTLYKSEKNKWNIDIQVQSLARVRRAP
ncbi:hypothetical protein NO1_1457 [Candidatus Termititenax aidoneus]|uniref:Uncharacterized protein n=1 Tax=Termititenax aidoneus TaxID=2218524 RepID=A0A388TBQ0_TERA1|nr:hypothetical protein NO1_1457 [Candidatus Termititenax aidoneus]